MRTALSPSTRGARQYLKQLSALLAELDPGPLDNLLHVLHSMRVDESGSVWVMGNGGSQANASHLVLHLSEHTIPAHDLLAETASITALSNDTDYSKVGLHKLRRQARRGDILIAITGSGDSPNIVMACAEARHKGMYIFGLLGFAGGVVRSLCDDFVLVPSTNYGQIEDAHSSLIHIISGGL